MPKHLLLSLLLLLAACCSIPTTDHLGQKQLAAETTVRLALALMQQGYMKDAKEKLLIAANLAPRSPLVYSGFCFYFEQIGDIYQADRYYQKALLASPDSGVINNNYGTYCYHKGDYPQALKHFLAAVKDPKYLDTALAYENAGLAAMKNSELQLARQLFTKALAQDHSLATSRYYLKLFNAKS